MMHLLLLTVVVPSTSQRREVQKSTSLFRIREQLWRGSKGSWQNRRIASPDRRLQFCESPAFTNTCQRKCKKSLDQRPSSLHLGQSTTVKKHSGREPQNVHVKVAGCPLTCDSSLSRMAIQSFQRERAPMLMSTEVE